ncbi:MAG: hypothetical protein ACK559_03430, partial [bacterium]
LGTDAAAGARPVLDDHRLAQGLLELGADHAPDHVRSPSGRKRCDHAHGLHRPGRLREGARRHRGGTQREGAADRAATLTVCRAHRFVLLGWISPRRAGSARSAYAAGDSAARAGVRTVGFEARGRAGRGPRSPVGALRIVPPVAARRGDGRRVQASRSWIQCRVSITVRTSFRNAAE